MNQTTDRYQVTVTKDRVPIYDGTRFEWASALRLLAGGLRRFPDCDLSVKRTDGGALSQTQRDDIDAVIAEHRAAKEGE